MKNLTKNEEILLLGIWKLRNQAYGVKIMGFYQEVTGKIVGFGTLYNNLDQLVRKGYVISQKGEPTASRGGKRKVFYRIAVDGLEALGRARELNKKIWQDIPEGEFLKEDSE